MLHHMVGVQVHAITPDRGQVDFIRGYIMSINIEEQTCGDCKYFSIIFGCKIKIEPTEPDEDEWCPYFEESEETWQSTS